jgi:serine/threonine-protein kinase
VPAPAEEPKPAVERAERPEHKVAANEGHPRHSSPRKATPAPAPAPVPKGPPGMLSFRVLPWADVFVDGTHVGTTPFEPVEVPPGKHEVRLVNDRLEAEKKRTVFVKSGVETQVNERLP